MAGARWSDHGRGTWDGAAIELERIDGVRRREDLWNEGSRLVAATLDDLAAAGIEVER